MDYYISVIFKTGEAQTAMIGALLMDIGFEGMEENEKETIASIPEPLFDEETIKLIFEQFEVPYTLNKVEQQNWNAQWEQSFEPVQVDEFAVIRASFHAPIAGVKHDIIITPKMSFGTGHHATTFLMIQEMSVLEFTGKTVIDFGTGTGVLAILAEKMGATDILGIDNDEWSINNAKENITANECQQITLEKADEMTTDKKADIVLANINLNVIIANISLIKNACLPKASILLSGLLKEDEAQISEILAISGFQIQKIVHKNNWIAILTNLR